MSSPTSMWGNYGNPLYATTLQNPTADIYPNVPGVTTTTPNSTDGPPLGQNVVLPDGTFTQFLQAVGTLAASAACIISGAWQNNFVVTPLTAINQLVVGVNDRGGAALAANNCTWFTTRGLAFPLTAATTAAGKIVASSAVSGTLYGATPGTDMQGNMVNTVLVGGSVAASPVYIM